MRAIVCAPSNPDRIEFRDLPEPSPAPDEVVIAVHAVSLNRGEYRRLRWERDGWRPGYDIAGIVARAAADGSGPAAGTRVVGVLPNGSWAQRVAVPTRRVAPIPDELEFVPASALPVAGLTSLAALAHGGPLLGRRVLVTGAAGGVGRFAVQLAALMGAHVTAQVGGPERGAGLRDLGANDVVTSLDADGEPFHLVIESIGGPLLATALGRLSQHGCLVLIGASSDEPTTFDPLRFARKGPISMVGMSLFLELERHGFGSPELASLVDLAATGRLDPQIDRVGSWREMGTLLEALGARRIKGKAVAVVDQD
jgi:NADPH:quinone reductase-like Zn-dependent oxidoreductase